MENELMTAEDLAAKGVPVAEPPSAAEPPPATKVMPVIDTEPPEPPPPEIMRTHCPNCDSPGIRKGKLIICEVCDAAFRYTKEGPKVEELGPFDRLENRVTALERKDGDGGIVPAEPIPAEPIPAEPIEEDDGI